MADQPTHDEIIKSLEENWRAEIQSARTYRELAEAEHPARGPLGEEAQRARNRTQRQ